MKTLRILLPALCLLALLLFSCSGNKEQYAPVEGRIMTRWASSLTPANCWKEYPRPQLVRKEWKDLNGLWDYAVVPSKEGADPAEWTPSEINSWDGKILVPFAIESALSGVGKHVGDSCRLVYERLFSVPGKWSGRRTVLHFDAVDWAASVSVNGVTAVTHTGGYVPFSADITDLLVPGENTLRVEVYDATDDNTQPRGKQVSRPRGIWYTSVTGIWQSVWMEPVAADRIEAYYTECSLEDGTIYVFPEIEGEGELTVALREGGKGWAADTGKPGKRISEAVVSDGRADLKAGEVLTWSPESPYLYALEFTLRKDGKVVDRALGYAAFREISVSTDEKGLQRLALNGEPLFQYGPLDQGWWPDGLYTAPCDEALRFDIEKTKEFGYNMIRKHIKVEPSRWYAWCDRLGILVWQDMPSITDHRFQKWDQNTPYGGTEWDAPAEVRKTYYKEWGEIISHLRTFPSIVTWVPFNEAWAQFETSTVVNFTRAQDPTRLINSASGGNFFAEVGDILDSHHYPDPKMRLWADTLVNVLGEYGGIGLAVEGHLWQPDRNWGYVQYKTGEEVFETYAGYAEQLKGEIARGCAAAVYTQTTDVEIEVNGLMTYDREVIKMDASRLREVNLGVIASMKQE